MAARKSEPSPAVRHDEAGDTFQLGFTVGKVFVPVAHVSGDFVRSLTAADDQGAEAGSDQEGGE